MQFSGLPYVDMRWMVSSAWIWTVRNLRSKELEILWDRKLQKAKSNKKCIYIYICGRQEYMYIIKTWSIDETEDQATASITLIMDSSTSQDKWTEPIWCERCDRLSCYRFGRWQHDSTRGVGKWQQVGEDMQVREAGSCDSKMGKMARMGKAACVWDGQDSQGGKWGLHMCSTSICRKSTRTVECRLVTSPSKRGSCAKEASCR